MNIQMTKKKYEVPMTNRFDNKSPNDRRSLAQSFFDMAERVEKKTQRLYQCTQNGWIARSQNTSKEDSAKLYEMGRELLQHT